MGCRAPKVLRKPAPPNPGTKHLGGRLSAVAAVADCAGGEWPNLAHRALIELFDAADQAEDVVSDGALLLADIRTAG
jgi:hypothetical protein